jgi:predicted CoA-binding protein
VDRETKRTVVLGASPKPERYSNMAVRALTRNGFEAIPIGIREGEIAGISILTGMPKVEDVHTVTLYVGAKNQPGYYDYILGLNPKRIIFNPGAENDELHQLAQSKGIEVLEACNLVMLSVGNF